MKSKDKLIYIKRSAMICNKNMITCCSTQTNIIKKEKNVDENRDLYKKNVTKASQNQPVSATAAAIAPHLEGSFFLGMDLTTAADAGDRVVFDAGDDELLLCVCLGMRGEDCC